MKYIGTIERDNELKGASQIVIYGAGKVGKEVLGFLKENGWLGRVSCFCDNDNRMWGSSVEGVLVISLLEATGRYPQGTYLIASLCVRQMLESLLGYGIEDIHVIRES